MTNPRSSYREADVRGASAVRLVVLLYEQVIQDLRRAIKALEQNDIEVRAREINHAISVLAHLQGNLNKGAGGNVARDLERYYNCLRGNLVEAHMRSSARILSQQITDLLTLREAWMEVDRAEAARAPIPSRTATRNPTPKQNARADWNG
jgi:flagellar protein FliS